MSLFEPGRVVVKIAGRDAGRKGVVVEQLDSIHVLVDGDLRRRKVNVRHLEPLPEVMEMEPGAAHEDVAKEFGKRGWAVWERKAKQRSEREEGENEEKKGEESTADEKKAKKVVRKKEGGEASP